jgi:hypothetical protein
MKNMAEVTARVNLELTQTGICRRRGTGPETSVRKCTFGKGEKRLVVTLDQRSGRLSTSRRILYARCVKQVMTAQLFWSQSMGLITMEYVRRSASIYHAAYLTITQKKKGFYIN